MHAHGVFSEVGSSVMTMDCSIPCRPVRPSSKLLVGASWLVWLLLAVLGGAAFGHALEDRVRAVQLTATTGLWIGWAAVAVALVVPSAAALTMVRLVVPAGLVCAVVAAKTRVNGLNSATDDAIVAAVICVVLAATMCLLVAAGEFGRWMIQASAYGDEQRFPLRPPAPFALPASMSWLLLCACAISGPLLVASSIWLPGVALSLMAVALAFFLAPRFHRFSRRWVVIVPAGLVIHDHVVLAETVMFPRSIVTEVALALADTQAADLTGRPSSGGPSSGVAVEVSLSELATIVLAPTRARPVGTALHVRSLLVAPTRPGSLIAALASQRSW